ncbi:MAG: threonine/serine dehydratase [Burkholderiales bacterium]|nr:threonine/serine dehydratase [Burkholderiales bacterium]
MNPGEIRHAMARVGPRLRRTPVIELPRGAFGIDATLVLKLECMQHTGSFKPRGALNRMLANPLPAAGVIAASGGNHGAAVAWAARALGVDAEVFVPASSSAAKIERIRAYGARTHVGGAAYADAFDAMQKRALETGALVVHAYDQPETVAGQGTLALEFEAQAFGLDSVVIACGGGGLLGGVAAWFESRVRVVAVEPRDCPTLFQARATGAPTDVSAGGIAADSLGARRIGTLAFTIAARHVADCVLVDDAAIRTAQRALWEECRVAAEPGGATALAALMAGAWRPGAGERVGVLVCGANLDPASLA